MGVWSLSTMSNSPVNLRQTLRLSIMYVTTFLSFGLCWLHSAQKWGPDNNKGLYKHKIIQDAVNQVWFHNNKDEGVCFPKFYRPLPEVRCALLLMAVRLVIQVDLCISDTYTLSDWMLYWWVCKQHLQRHSVHSQRIWAHLCQTSEQPWQVWWPHQGSWYCTSALDGVAW